MRTCNRLFSVKDKILRNVSVNYQKIRNLAKWLLGHSVYSYSVKSYGVSFHSQGNSVANFFPKSSLKISSPFALFVIIIMESLYSTKIYIVITHHRVLL
jgi:hypothetical protein